MALAAGARIQPRSVRGGHKRQSLEKCGRRSSPDPAHITMFIITWVWTPEPASNSPTGLKLAFVRFMWGKRRGDFGV